MVGKGTLVYGIVFSVSLTLAILPFTIPAYAAIDKIKFDQLEIPEGHSDVITIIDSPAPLISEISSTTFEGGFNTWTNTAGDSNDCWRHRTSPTPTGNTGPSNPSPNTGAPELQGTKSYVFYESSNGCSPNTNPPQQAFLLGPAVDFDAFNSVEIIFSRHMFGDKMGTLTLELEDSPGSGTFTGPQNPIWSQTDDQGDQWDEIIIDLSTENGSGLRQLRFVAEETVAGNSADMAVDEITIQGIAIGPPPTIEIKTEGFENDFTFFDNADGDENQCWRIGPPSRGHTSDTGPSSAVEGIKYAYYEASTGCSPGAQHAFLLYQETIDFNSYSGVEVQFQRHMSDGGFNHMGTLTLELEDSPGSRTFTGPQNPIWSQTGDQGDQWDLYTVNLSSHDNTGQRQLRFVATETGSGAKGDMSVDDIIIKGAPNVHEVKLEVVGSSEPPIFIDLPKRGSNIYWQLVEFGPEDSSEENRHLKAIRGDTVRVTAPDGQIDEVMIIDPNDGTINTELVFYDNSPAFCNDPAAGLGGDWDEDGICDAWEDPGAGNAMVVDYPPPEFGYVPYTMDNFTAGHVCDSFLQVEPPVNCYGSDQRDIYVEIDYMVGHRPNEEALYEVIEAFANAPASAPGKPPGIRLHIQLDENTELTEIAHQNCIIFPGDNADHGFDQIKEVIFGTVDEHNQEPLLQKWGEKQKNQIFHYALFVHSQCGSSGSGVGEYPGNDLMVTLGPFTGGLGNPDEQAGTFMHELGHNLNLNHGGIVTDETNCKPNHLSVMNYARQFPIINADRSLDFSRQALGTLAHSGMLKENALSETDVFDTYNYNPNEPIIFGPIPPVFPPSTHETIDWDQTPDNSPGASELNLNGIPGIGGCDDTQNDEELMGYADWDRGIMNLTARDSLGWSNGRTIAAVFTPAVWENGSSDLPSVLSQTCPSLQQIIDWADPTVLAKSRENPFTSPNTHGIVLAQEKIKGHLDNYRICAGGAGQSDTQKLTTTYLSSYLYSIDDIIKHYLNNPADKLSKDKLQSHYTAIVSVIEENKNTLDIATETKLQGIKSAIEVKAKIHNVKLETPSKEYIFEVQPIFAQDELTINSVKNMSALRLNSTIQYLESLEPNHFINNDTSVIDDEYKPIFNKAIEFVQNDNYTGAIMLLSNINHSAYIQNSSTIQKLEFATDTTIDQYTRAIPEFGAIATLILVAAITSIIILTSKARNIFMPKNYQ